MSCFVTTIDLSLADKLRTDLAGQGFALSHPQYTVFQAKKSGLSCTLYTSGKLTVQGKDKDEFITYYLEPEILGTFGYSYPTAAIDKEARIGVDEAGKGDFFGPLCVAAVYANEEGLEKLMKIGVRDSKNMNDVAIAQMAKQIAAHFPHEIISLFPPKYNELYAKFANLNRLLAWGHARAIAALAERTECYRAIIDQFGREELVEYALDRQNVKIDLTQRHKGESDPVVAAASILARDAFVKGIERLSREIGMTLPKGASAQVVRAARALGKERLPEVAKTHFKTYAQIH